MSFPQNVLPEDVLRDYVDVVVRLTEAAGALVILIGAVVATARFLLALAHPRRDHQFTGVRLSLGRYLVLGLELQLASDIVSTSIAPSFEEIGKLAAIAAIRTLLNYFLRKELDAEQGGQPGPDGARAATG